MCNQTACYDWSVMTRFWTVCVCLKSLGGNSHIIKCDQCGRTATFDGVWKFSGTTEEELLAREEFLSNSLRINLRA